MRSAFALVLVALAGGCSSEGASNDDAPPLVDSGPPPEPAFKLQSPEIEVMPGQNVAYCWYFRTPNPKPLAIQRWTSSMASGAHHMVLFTTRASELKPAGMVTTDCGGSTGLGYFPGWLYSSASAEDELKLPEDGEGKPLAMELPANQAAYVRIHFINTGTDPIKSSVQLAAYALDDSVAYTKTASYVTYNSEISVPPMSSGRVVSKTCDLSATGNADAKFWMMTTLVHRFATRFVVKDGTQTMIDRTEREDLVAKRFDPPFVTFSGGKLTYECTYTNPNTFMIIDGDSMQYDESCMTAGYFFPAKTSVFCQNQTSF